MLDRVVRGGAFARVAALAAALAIAAGEAAGADGAPPDVRTLMTPEEFRESGLGKLSTEEVEALNRWLLRFTARDAAQLREHNPVVREEVKKVDETGYRTRVVGEFRGWDGETVFRLENGEVWKQRHPGRFFYRATSPEVELRRNFLGYWELRVVEADRAVGVKRVD